MSKAIDKAAGVERTVIPSGPPVRRMIPGADQHASGSWIKDDGREYRPGERPPITDDAIRWQGWGTALKPAMELIVVARKPLTERSVAANVLRHGTGAINVDASRVGFASAADEAESKGKNRHGEFGTPAGGNHVYGDFSMVPPQNYDAAGRWPANVALDEEAARLLDEQSGELHSQRPETRRSSSQATGVTGFGTGNSVEYPDTGGASRFFYTAKADAAERSAGLGRRNSHPTVKPLPLMAWLIKMVTPSGGVVLDPFLGSGTTAIAAIGNGFDWIGIEREAEYVAIAEQRIGLGCRVVVV